MICFYLTQWKYCQCLKAYMDYMNPNVCCPKKGIKLSHSLTHLEADSTSTAAEIRKHCWGQYFWQIYYLFHQSWHLRTQWPHVDIENCLIWTNNHIITTNQHYGIGWLYEGSIMISQYNKSKEMFIWFVCVVIGQFHLYPLVFLHYLPSNLCHWSSSEECRLTLWGRVKHICFGKVTIIGSDNGLLPRWRQAIIWTNAGILLIGPFRTNFSEILIEIHTFSFKKMHLKISSGKWQPSCLGLNVLIDHTNPLMT